MKILRRLASGLNRASLFMASTAASWEGHQSDRRWENIPKLTTSQDDTVETDREQIIAAARVMCQLFGLGNRILKTYANYTVGNCDVSWHTEDEDWNDKATELFEVKRGMLDVRGREDFAGLARMAVIHMLRDGDIGFVKVSQPGWPMVEPVEADRIGPRSLVLLDPAYVGGVRVDTNQRPVGYYVAQRQQNYGFKPGKEVPAASFLHVYDNLRFDATRGVSCFASGALGRSRTLRQLIRSEEVGVQTANKWAVLVKMANAIRGLPNLNLSDENTEVTSSASGNPLKVAELHDGMIQKLEPGEDVTTVGSNRPSSTWTGFIEFLIRDFAISLDLPYEFVWNMSALTGPGVRMTSRQAERSFAWAWNVINRRFLTPLVTWWISDQMAEGLLPFNAQFLQFVIQRPAHPTIDAGRESQANIAEYDKGFMSGLEICGERGQNIYTVMRQKARELAYAQELSAEFGVPASQIISGTVSNPALPAGPPARQDQQKEDEDEREDGERNQRSDR